MKIPRYLSVFFVLFAAPLIGCGDATSQVEATAQEHEHDHDHDHADQPESMHAAVAELTEIRDTIRDAILNGDPHDAHGPLHEIGELLEAIPSIAAETDLPKEEWDAVNAANEELFDAFGAIDKAFHTKDGDKKAAYEGVAEKLDEAIESMHSRLTLTGEELDSGEAAHDVHDGHEHGAEHDHDENLSQSGATS